jgi:hypothetical protein
LTPARDFNPLFLSVLHNHGHPFGSFHLHYLHDWNREYDNSLKWTNRDPTDHDRMMVTRLELYNESLRLRDRLCAMKGQPHIEEITVEDIELPWKDSGLKIALSTEEELADLTFEDIRKLSSRQLHILKMRLSHILKREDLVVSITDTIQPIRLFQLRSIPGAQLNDFVTDISAEILPIFTSEQLSALNLLTLDDQKFQIVLKDEERLRKVLPDIFVQCFERIVRLMPLSLDLLSEEQVKTINLGNVGLSGWTGPSLARA